MKIIIPTYKRTDHQVTFNSLPPEWQAKTRFIVNKEDARKLERMYEGTGARFIVHPPEITTIQLKRAWILRQERWDKMLMLDDDLVPSSKGEDGKLVKATHEDIDTAFRAIDAKLDTYAHVGVSSRIENHMAKRKEMTGATSGFRKPDKDGWCYNVRMIYALGYRASIIRKVCVLGRIGAREDMELTLQLLTKGYQNAVYYNLAFEQWAGYENSQRKNKDKYGGADRRTEHTNAEALKLAKLFPGLVTVVKKDYKRSTKRWEVVVSWKKAIDQGLRSKRGFFKR